MRARHRVRLAVNLVNGVDAGRARRRAGRARPAGAGPDGLLTGTGYRLPVPPAPAFTMGNVIITRRGDLVADSTLFRHEARHTTQYAWCGGLLMLPLYFTAAGVSWLLSRRLRLVERLRARRRARGRRLHRPAAAVRFSGAVPAARLARQACQQPVPVAAVPVWNQANVADCTATSSPVSRNSSGAAERRDPVHDGLLVGPVAFGGGARVGDVGDLPGRQVDPGEARRCPRRWPTPARRPRQDRSARGPGSPWHRTCTTCRGSSVAGVPAHQLAGPVTGHDLPVPSRYRRPRLPHRADAPAVAVVANLVRAAAKVPASQRSATRSRQVSCQMLSPDPADPFTEQLGRQRRPGRHHVRAELVAPQLRLPYCPTDSQTTPPPSAMSPWVNPRSGCGTRPHHPHPVKPHPAIIPPARRAATRPDDRARAVPDRMAVSNDPARYRCAQSRSRSRSRALNAGSARRSAQLDVRSRRAFTRAGITSCRSPTTA